MTLLVSLAIGHFFRSIQSTAPVVAFSPIRRPMRVSRQSGSAVSYRQVSNHADVIDSFNGFVISSSKEKKDAPLPPVLSAPEIKQEKEKFNWFKAWYPLMPVEFLTREEPTPFELLGMDMVVYNDGEVVDESTGLPIGYGSKKDRPKNSRRLEGTWRAFVDACPHRKAPLSEGRVEDDGTLMCSYHGWRWNGDGDLHDVPQAHSNELERIKNNPKSRCNAFPTKVKNGVLWVWPDSSQHAKIESELTPITEMSLDVVLDREGIDESRVITGNWHFRHLPYGWDFFVENVIDPAHAPFAHHSSVSNRYTEPRPMDVRVVEDISKNGFRVEYSMDFDGGEAVKSFDKFSAPGHVEILTTLEDGARHIIEMYISPSKPGFCNALARQSIVKTEDGRVPLSGRETRDKQIKGLLLTKKLPKWVGHIFTNQFLNEDGIFLHLQERHLHRSGEYSTLKHKEEESDSYTDAVLPISSDKGVLVFRKWMKDVAGGRIPFRGDLTMPPVDMEAAVDTYHSHTKHCIACSGALKNLEKVRFASLATAVALCIWHPLLLGKIGTSVIVASLGGVALITEKIIGLLFKMECNHSEND